MTNAEIATIILAAYTFPGLIIAWVTMDSKEFAETFDRMSMFEQTLFILNATLFWPVVVLKAVGKYREMRGRKRR